MYMRSLGHVLVALAVAGLPILYQSRTPVLQGKRMNQQDKNKDDGARLLDEHTGETAPLNRQVEAARVRVSADGNYACCIAPACSWCLLHMSKCVCVMGVGSGQGACRECHGGWEAAQGSVPGRTKEDVRKMKTFMVASELEGSETAEPASSIGQTVSGPISGQARGRSHVMQAKRSLDAGGGGPALFRGNNCLSCHKMGGSGGSTGPDLSHEALRHASIDWQIRHLKNPSKVSPGSAMPAYSKLRPEELRALAAFLVTRK